jgi:nucleoid-associated protein EbfC
VADTPDIPDSPDTPDPDRGAGSGDDSPAAGLDGLLSQAMEMQQQMMEAQAQAAQAVVEGQAGGGAVRVRVTGAMEFESVHIAPEAVDPDDVDLLQDLVLAALHDAVGQVNALQSESLGGLGDLLGGGGVGDLLGGAGLGDLFGGSGELFGGGGAGGVIDVPAHDDTTDDDTGDDRA